MTAHESSEQRRLAMEKVAGPAETLKSIQEAAKKYQEQPEGVEALRKLMAEARDEAKKYQSIAAKVTGPEKKAAITHAAECNEKVKSISREITALYSNARRTVMTEVIIPGQKSCSRRSPASPSRPLLMNPVGRFRFKPPPVPARRRRALPVAGARWPLGMAK